MMLLSLAPEMKNPPAKVSGLPLNVPWMWLPKLPLWKWVAPSTMIVRTGMATFHVVIVLLNRVSQATPTRLMITNTIMRTTAAPMPAADKVLVLDLYQLLAHE